MYTQCPSCDTVFAVGIEQLRAARGQVRCGNCLDSFDAIANLREAPPGVDAPEAAPLPAPQLDASAGRRLSATLETLRGPVESGADGEPPAAAGDATADTALTASAERSLADAGRDALPVLDDSAFDRHSLPPAIREDLDRLAAADMARRRNLAYGAGALALLLALAAQYVWFMPADAAQRYPQWRGAIERFCDYTGCKLPVRRDPGQIRVISRDVRVHPRYEGVLQVKATLINVASFRQPYPRLRFTLFNVNGQTIATRTFEPSEYLGEPLYGNERLRPRTPFQVGLELLAPEEAAVSFEFEFL